MEWRLVFGPGRSRWRDLAIAFAVFIILLIPVAFAAEYLLKQYTRRSISKFTREAESILYSLAGRVREYNTLIESMAGQGGPPPAIADRFPEIETIGYVDTARGTTDPRDLGKFVDLAHSKEQQLAANAAVAANRPVMTAKRGAAPFLIFRPVKPGVLAVLVLVPQKLVTSRFSNFKDINVEIYEGPISAATLIADSDPHTQLATAENPPSLHYTSRIAAFQRIWTIYIASKPRFDIALRLPTVLFVLASFLLAMLVWSLLSTRRRSFELGTKMLNTFADLIAVIAADRNIASVSGSLAADLQKVIGKDLIDLIHPEDKVAVQESLQGAASSDHPEKFGAVRIEAADGSWHELEGSIQRMTPGKASSELLLIAHDVTELHVLARQLDRAARVESLGRVAAKVAHEFNNVLMGVQTNIDVLQRKYPSDAQIQSSTDMMRRSVNRGTQIAGEILRFSRPTQVREAPIDVESWLRQIEEELRPILPEKIEFGIEVSPDHLRLCGDAAQLSQVVVNLVLNARDAIQNQGRVLCAASRSTGGKFAFGFVPSGDFAHVRISDDGEGMTADAVQHMFEPLFTTKRHGTGLGLAISYQIVSAHRGFMFAESTPGKGTNVHLFLPSMKSGDSCGSRG